MPPDRAAVLTTLTEFDEIEASAFFAKYRFGPSTRFDLVFHGKRYPPKAIYAVSFKFSDGRPLPWKKAYGGKRSNDPLRALGFLVVAKGGYEDEDLNNLPPRSEDELMNYSIMLRRGQQKFRDALLGAYSTRCAVSGCKVACLLDAAHVRPYYKAGEYAIDNGILLRTDLHTLFDMGLLRISPEDLVVHVDVSVEDEAYRALHGCRLFQPKNPKHQVRKEFLAERWCR